MAIKVLVTADLHLGKKSSAIPADLKESATIYTWRNIVEYAITEQVDALLLAGDIIDRDNRYFEAIGPLQEGFTALIDAEIPTVMVSGNHDFDVLPEVIHQKPFYHVHLLGNNGQWEAATVPVREGALQLLGWSFPSQYVKNDPSLEFKPNNLDMDPNLPTIGLLHGDVGNQKSKYAPININNLIVPSLNCWVLGHIHKPGILNSENPLILYPGSPHALSPKEKGEHGPYLLEFEGKDLIRADQIDLSPVKYLQIPVSITGVSDESDFRSKIIRALTVEAEAAPEDFENANRVVFDILLEGHHSNFDVLDQWSQEVDDFEQELLSDTIFTVRTVLNNAKPLVDNLEQLATQPTPPGILAQAILDLEAGKNSEFLEQFRQQFKRELDSLNTSPTFRPLRLSDREELVSDDSSDELLLRECRHLLSTLLAQNAES